MKKVYKKPIVVFEDFSMSTNIAAGCKSIVTTHSKGTCTVEGTGGVALFVESVTACTYPVPDGSTNDGLCYHVPEGDYNLFNS